MGPLGSILWLSPVKKGAQNVRRLQPIQEVQANAGENDGTEAKAQTKGEMKCVEDAHQEGGQGWRESPRVSNQP